MTESERMAREKSDAIERWDEGEYPCDLLSNVYRINPKEFGAANFIYMDRFARYIVFENKQFIRVDDNGERYVFMSCQDEDFDLLVSLDVFSQIFKYDLDIYIKQYETSPSIHMDVIRILFPVFYTVK